MWLIVIVAFVFMFFHFYSNAYLGRFGLYSKSFLSWAESSEELVLKKIELAKTGGIFANAGFLTRGNNTFYRSQIGLQGMLFSIIDQIASLFTSNSLPYIKALNVIFFQIVLFLLLFWIKDEFGFGSAAVTYISIFGSYWLLVSTHNLFAVNWTMLLPFVIVLLLLRREEKLSRHFRKVMIVAVFLTVFIRIACGFEFASSVLIAAELPFIFYAIKNNWPFKQYFLRSLEAGITAVASFASAVAINIWQRVVFLGSFNSALLEIEHNIARRTGFFPMDTSGADYLMYGKVLEESLHASVLKVIYDYLHLRYIIVFLNAMEVILIVMVFAALCLMAKEISPSIAGNRRKLLAWVAMTGVSILAPISWFVLAKGHSYLHTNWNYILWNFPFLIIGIALCGAVIMYIIQDHMTHRKTIRKLTT